MSFGSKVPPQLAEAVGKSQKVTVVDPGTAVAVGQVTSGLGETNADLAAILAQDQAVNSVLGAQADPPTDIVEDTTPSTGITLLKGIKNYLRVLYYSIVYPGSPLYGINAVVIGANKTSDGTCIVPICDDAGKLLVNPGQVSIVDSSGNGINVDANGNLPVLATKSYLRETVVASEGRTTSGDIAGPSDYGPFAEILAQLNVTAHVGVTGTLDVKIQHSVDNGTTWEDLSSFTQVVATDGAEIIVISRWNFTGPLFFGNKLKVVWTLAGVDPNYTFNVDWVIKN